MDRLRGAAVRQTGLQPKEKHPTTTPQRQAELLSIIEDIKRLIVNIDDCIPLVNLWVSAVGGVESQAAAYSPSRLLQASYLVNVGDTQFAIRPDQPMQIGPDFTLSVYMLFRGHASASGSEIYGIEENQRKPSWQEVIHKSRVRLYRVPTVGGGQDFQDMHSFRPSVAYAYHVQIIEDLDDGRVHTIEEGQPRPMPVDGIPHAGIREQIPIGQISKIFYADVGKILNICNDDGTSSNPVLLFKRDVRAAPRHEIEHDTSLCSKGHLIEDLEQHTMLPDNAATSSEANSQADIDRQLQEESGIPEGPLTSSEAEKADSNLQKQAAQAPPWTFPANLDPEWIALEVLSADDSDEAGSSDDELRTEEEPPGHTDHQYSKGPSRTSVDANLVMQLHRMNIASDSTPSSRQSSRASGRQENSEGQITGPFRSHDISPTLIERSPFSAIKTSLSLLEMLLRLTSLQEFEQTTHLAIPDNVLGFYLDHSASTSGLGGKESRMARAEAEKKVGFDPYSDSPDP